MEEWREMGKWGKEKEKEKKKEKKGKEKKNE